ncbi:MAG: lysophospholipid acyltransferase family protein [Myxococcales bacterium]
MRPPGFSLILPAVHFAIRVARVLVWTLLLAPWPLSARLLTAGRGAFPLRVGARVMHLWARAACHAFGVRIQVHGRPPRGPLLFASNHLGYLDILVLSACYPSAFVSMVEVARWPLVGWLARLVGTIFIERYNSDDVPRVRQQIRERLALGLPVTFFPEARPSPGVEVARFHAALFQAAIDQGASCVPVTLGYECPDSPEPPSKVVCWWGDMAFGPHLRALLELGRIEARVTFGAPVEPGEDRVGLANTIHAAVRDRFVPVRQTRLEDGAVGFARDEGHS